MSRWYRAYEGTIADPKIGEAALVAGTSRSVAIAAWHAILESAASVQDGGRFDTTARRVAAALGEPLGALDAMFAAFDEIGLTAEGVVTAWARRQYESDKSSTRTKQWRDKKKGSCDGDVTSQNAVVTPPETETETETETEAEKIEDKPLSSARSAERGLRDAAKAAFRTWYEAYPKHVEPLDAEKTYIRIVVARKATIEQLLTGAKSYAAQVRRDGTEKRYIKAPPVWLNKGCWGDEEIPPPRTPQNVTPIRGGYDASRSTTAEARRQLARELGNETAASLSDAEARWSGDLLQIGGPEGRNAPDGLLSQGRSGGPGNLYRFGG